MGGSLESGIKVWRMKDQLAALAHRINTTGLGTCLNLPWQVLVC